MGNAWLTWCLESKGHLLDVQCGVRKNRSTVYLLVRSEPFVREAFIKKVRAHLFVCFYLEKAYGFTWKYGILRYLYELEFEGRLPWSISIFLSCLLFQSKTGSVLTDVHVQQNGVTQGSIPSPVLLYIEISDIAKSVNEFAICFRDKALPTVIKWL